MTEQPWYPASWLDAEGKPLPDVHEVRPGEWPPCRPGDVIEALSMQERRSQRFVRWRDTAGGWLWGDHGTDTVVAIRIIKKAP